MYRFLIKTISFLILLTTIYSVNQWSSINIGSFFLWWIVFILIIFCSIKLIKYVQIRNSKDFLIVKIYIAWIIICIVRGFIIADNYWELKHLITTSFVLLMPISVFINSNEQILSQIIRTWIKFAIPIFFIFFIFILDTEAYGRYFVPISFLALFFPLLNTKYKLLVFVLTTLIFFIDFTARSNVIKAITPLVFSSFYYFRFFISNKLFKVLHSLLITLPFILFLLVIYADFNIFKMDEYVEGEYESTAIEIDGSESVESLISDTRTFLYIEVIESSIKNNYELLGRTPARGNDSTSFGYETALETKTGKYERFSNEVAILNIYTWTGLIGLLLYYLIFAKASYLAIYKSRNIFIKIIGLFVAFRWCFSWVEEFSRFNLSNIFLWILIGICFSESFRTINNVEFKNLIRRLLRIK